MSIHRCALALLVGFATFASAETASAQRASAQREIMVSNNAGMPITVQIGMQSFDLQPGGVARARLNTTNTNGIKTISASGVFRVDGNNQNRHKLQTNPTVPGTMQGEPGTNQGGQSTNQGAQGQYQEYQGQGGGQGAAVTAGTITVMAKPVQTNISSGGRTSFSVTRSGRALRIN